MRLEYKLFIMEDMTEMTANYLEYDSDNLNKENERHFSTRTSNKFLFI